jgi:putative ABC transport system permease protein
MPAPQNLEPRLQAAAPSPRPEHTALPRITLDFAAPQPQTPARAVRIGAAMSFLGFVFRNVVTRKTRALLTALAIAISIMTVVTMGILTQSLRQTAINIIRTGEADFTVSQRGLNDILQSAIDEEDVQTIRGHEDVESAIGVLVNATELDRDHPFFIRIGIEREALEGFGLQIVAGRAFEPDSRTEAILGYRAAREFKKTIGDTIVVSQNEYTIVGISNVGQVQGDLALLVPLSTLQVHERRPGTVTLILVKAKEGADVDAIRERITSDFPDLATVRSESEFGQVDRNLRLLSAANSGVTIIALVIGAITVANTMMLTVFERTREIGILRAIGWPRWRILLGIMSEAFAVAWVAAMAGVGLGFIMVRIIGRAPELQGVFHPQYTGDVFGRALGIAFGMALIGAIYPAIRAALIVPLAALRHE